MSVEMNKHAVSSQVCLPNILLSLQSADFCKMTDDALFFFLTCNNVYSMDIKSL